MASPDIKDPVRKAQRPPSRRAGGRGRIQAPHDGPDLIDRTLAVWQPMTDRKLSREDGREIIENMMGFFKLLLEWDAKERREARASKPKRPPVAHDAEFDCAPNPTPAD